MREFLYLIAHDSEPQRVYQFTASAYTLCRVIDLNSFMMRVVADGFEIAAGCTSLLFTV